MASSFQLPVLKYSCYESLYYYFPRVKKGLMQHMATVLMDYLLIRYVSISNIPVLHWRLYSAISVVGTPCFLLPWVGMFHNCSTFIIGIHNVLAGMEHVQSYTIRNLVHLLDIGVEWSKKNSNENDVWYRLWSAGEKKSVDLQIEF